MGLFENIKSESIEKLDWRNAVCVAPNETVRKVIEAMRDGRIGCAVLVDPDQRPVGFFTESRLTQILASGTDALNDPVQKYVDDTWPQVSVSDPIAFVLQAMVSRNTRFLPIVDAEGRVVGVTGQKGLMEFVADHFPGQVTVQRIGQKPYMHEREGA